MAHRKGHHVPISFPRRVVIDFLRNSENRPLIGIERRVQLGDMIQLRDQIEPRLGWLPILIKAYGIVSARWPQLRRIYIRYPWPRFYEHPDPIASVIIEREWQNEPIVLPALLTNPEKQTLPAIQSWLMDCKVKPFEEIKSFRKAIWISKFPWPIRPFLWWIGLNCWGYEGVRFLGTYGVSVIVGVGASQFYMLGPWTSMIYYGFLEPDGTLPLRMTFDHRMFDGAVASRILVDLENVLKNEIRNEMLTLTPPAETTNDSARSTGD